MKTLSELLIIAIGSAIVNNVVLSQFLGICPFLGVSKKVETATGMGGAVVFVITLSSLLTSLIYKFILVPLGFEYLQTIVFILFIAALVQFVEMFLKKAMPSTMWIASNGQAFTHVPSPRHPYVQVFGPPFCIILTMTQSPIP